jgi:hypothetical protein
MSTNRVEADRRRLEERNYVRMPKRSGGSYVALFEKRVIVRYDAKCSGDFNLIIVGDKGKEDDFYMLPYAQIKAMLTTQRLDRDQTRRERWRLTIRNHKLTVGPSRNHPPLPVGDFYGAEVRLDTEAEDEDEVAEALERVHARGQGFPLDSKLRKALEQHAMAAAKKHFEGLKYSVTDRSKDYPYDLECRKDGEVWYVEVKGTQTEGGEIILTHGEVKFAKGHKDHMSLFVLHSIWVPRKGDGLTLSGGKPQLLMPWDVDLTRLTPLSYKYEL